MKKALILGCSHAAGSEMGTEEYNRANSYPVLLAERRGYVAHNLAIGGGSNDAMFRIFESEHKDYNIVIACWSGHNRSEAWNKNKQEWISFCPGADLIKLEELSDYVQQWVVHHTDETTGRLNKLKNIVALNTLAQAHDVPVINIDSFWPVHGYAWPSNVHWPVSTTFWNWADAQGYAHTPWGHFGRDAHSAFADYILENLAN
jgi:hypothetical protein